MIEVLIFDLGKVVVDFDYRRSVSAVLTLNSTAAARIQSIMGGHELLVKYETGQISSVEFHREVCERLGLICTLEEFRQIWGAMFLPSPLLSDAFLAFLARRYRLLLLSNTNELHFEYVLERYPILRHFSAHVLSYREGSLKPDQKIYQAVIRASRVDPSRIFFTDDRPENVDAAVRLGIQAVLFQSEVELQKEMENLGIVVEGA
jgi:FMN phosphatase YigB (HAD superfamily)